MKTTFTITRICLIMVLAATMIFGTSCYTAKTAMKNGNYDAAVAKAVKKLRKKPGNDKHVLILEKAFANANMSDLDRIAYLQKEGVPENWVKIYEEYMSIKKRQTLVAPLLPLDIGEEYRKAKINLVDVDNELITAKKEAAEYLYSKANSLLLTGTRQNAREAYYAFNKVKEMYADYKDVSHLIDTAKEKGTNNILFTIQNRSNMILPRAFENELNRISVVDLNDTWTAYYKSEPAGKDVDYDIVFNVKVLDAGPEQVRETSETVSKEVADGWDYLLDANGNVRKDTAGNDLKIEKFKTITATVLTVEQTKVAKVAGSVDYFDRSNGNLLKSLPVESDAIFSNFAGTYTGDEDALTDEHKKLIGNRPSGFPTDFDLLTNAAENLKPTVKNIIDRNQSLVLK